jgi:hypothetical protein
MRSMSRRLALRTALALGALIACLARPALAAPAGNLLANPGFEETLAGHPWMAAAWDTSWSEMPTVFFGRDTLGAHGGRYAVSVANVSTLVPLWYNWSQTLVVGREMWNKDVVLSVWTRSNGVQGRAYILLQAYRDTVGKMARIWKVSRDTSLERLGLHTTSDPYAYLGAKREYFSDNETDWVRRQVRVFIPPSTNLIIARCGLFGTGQVLFDDASLTVEDALPAPEPPVGVNLLEDPGFEESGNRWEYSLPPYNEMRCDRETTVVHSGKASVRFMGGTTTGWVKARAGVAQLIGNRNLAGKRIRLSGWVKCDSLKGLAYIKLYCTTLQQDEDVGTPRQIGETTPWTQLTMEMDVPKDAYQVWAWLLYNAPAEGRVYFDDASLVVLGPASGASQDGTPAAAPPVKPRAAKKSAGPSKR